MEYISEHYNPITKEKIILDLHDLGLQKGNYLFVHVSLSKIGYVIGRQQTIIDALIEVVGEEGLIVMPAHTSENSNPADWNHPPVPKEWMHTIKEATPAFDPLTTPTNHIGVVPELFRTYPSVYRSSHPEVSFSAYGKRNRELLIPHPLSFSLNDEGPMGKIAQWNFKIVMIGTDYTTCTGMHLSEYRAQCREVIPKESAMFINGQRCWVSYEDMDLDSDNFNSIGEAFEKEYPINTGFVGYAVTKVLPFTDLIDYTTNYLSK